MSRLSERFWTFSVTKGAKVARQAHSYAWALHIDASKLSRSQLSEEAQDGLQYAEELARNAQTRARQNVLGEPSFTTLTINELAELEGVHPSTVRRWIKH